MLFFAGLVATNGSRVADQLEWATEVLKHESAFRAHGASGLPEHWRPSKQINVPAIFQPLGEAYSSQWPDPRLDQIGKAMQAWDGDGQHAGLGVGQLKTHKSKYQSPKGPPRWKAFESLFFVAKTINRHGRELRKLLRIPEPLDAVPTPMEVMRQRAETAEQRAETAERRGQPRRQRKRRRRRRRTGSRRAGSRSRRRP